MERGRKDVWKEDGKPYGRRRKEKRRWMET
jgi:hypothetical protein